MVAFAPTSVSVVVMVVSNIASSGKRRSNTIHMTLTCVYELWMFGVMAALVSTTIAMARAMLRVVVVCVARSAERASIAVVVVR